MNDDLAKEIDGLLQKLRPELTPCFHSGTLDPSSLGLDVESVGSIALPLSVATCSELCDVAAPAPVGKGAQTVVDRNVRNGFEIDGSQVRLHEEWEPALKAVLRELREELNFSGELSASLYKLLIYPKGGYFRLHKDSHKQDDMVATLTVVLPSRFTGGALALDDGPDNPKIAIPADKYGDSVVYCAFYSDCDHEVLDVESGFRVSLTFNISQTLTPWQVPTLDSFDAATQEIVTALSTNLKEITTPIAVQMSHKYVGSELRFEKLKGADRVVADKLFVAARNANKLMFIGPLFYELHQDGGDAGYPSRRRYNFYDDFDEYFEDECYAFNNVGGVTPGETVAESLDIESLTPPNYAPTGYRLDVSPKQLFPQGLIEAIEFDSVEYESYSGNEGNTFCSRYRRGMFVITPRFYSAKSSAPETKMTPWGTGEAILQMLLTFRYEKALNNSHQFQFGDELERAIRFATNLLGDSHARWGSRFSPKSVIESIVTIASETARLDLIQPMLDVISSNRRIEVAPQSILELSLNLDRKQFVSFINEFFSTRLSRDISIGLEFCWFFRTKHKNCFIAGSLITDIVRAFMAQLKNCRHDPDSRNSHSNFSDFWRSRNLETVKLIFWLALEYLSSKEIEELKQTLVDNEFMGFEVDTIVVPAVLQLCEDWPALFDDERYLQLLVACKQKLQQLTKSKPQKPNDWSRSAIGLDSKIELSQQLIQFLESKTESEWSLRANKDDREYVEAIISINDLDAETETVRSGRPHLLRVKKNQRGFEKKLKQYYVNLNLIEEIDLLLED